VWYNLGMKRREFLKVLSVVPVVPLVVFPETQPESIDLAVLHQRLVDAYGQDALDKRYTDFMRSGLQGIVHPPQIL